MFTSDKDFEEALARPEALEKHLAKLENLRRNSFRLALFTTAVCFLNIFVTLWISLRDPKMPPSATIAVAITMAIGAIQQTGTALAAQADIRTLKAFKKLQELGLAARKQP
ncbi:hypothetical protein [Haloferula sp. BvORR071]|uniref:hypothetical protein n=1 Tax=Haloferula sp. BvORR071 TaxID=1396141 RepID=UPI000550BE64|nr:hypothetical protein [Haloferula sp. BvORR071]